MVVEVPYPAIADDVDEHPLDLNHPVLLAGKGNDAEVAPTSLPTRQSNESLHIDTSLYKTVHGRDIQNHQDEYMLPADPPEHIRLDLQHNTLKAQLRGLYPCPDLVQQTLRQDQDKSPKILDVGSGSARWTVEIAAEFPHAEVLALDMVPPQGLVASEVPPNYSWEKFDANGSFERFEGQYTFVHTRAIDGGIRNYENFLYELARTLRPNGVLVISSGYAEVYDEDHTPFPELEPGEPGFSWFHHTLLRINEAYHKRGNYGIEAKRHFPAWLESNPNYRFIATQDEWMPLGPWKPDMTRREYMISCYKRENMIRATRALRPLMLEAGFPEADVKLWIDETETELSNLKVHGLLRWRYCTAVRTDAPWVPNPNAELPPQLLESSYPYRLPE